MTHLVRCAIALVSIFNPLCAALADAECGTTSKSTSGYAQLCASCSPEYFYLYANQHVCIEDGRVVRESHSFSLSGALATSTEPKLLGVLRNWIVWETENVFLAVPANGDQQFFAKHKRQDRNGLSLAGWFQLTE
jgi:hypothetical protein